MEDYQWKENVVLTKYSGNSKELESRFSIVVKKTHWRGDIDGHIEVWVGFKRGEMEGKKHWILEEKISKGLCNQWAELYRAVPVTSRWAWPQFLCCGIWSHTGPKGGSMSLVAAIGPFTQIVRLYPYLILCHKVLFFPYFKHLALVALTLYLEHCNGLTL